MKAKGNLAKKSTVAVSAGALLALSACGGGGDGGSAGSGGDCELTFLASADRPQVEQDAYEEVFSNYEEEYDCTVNVRWQGAWNEITQQLSGAQLSGEEVNMIVSGTAARDLARSGTIMDLTTCIAPFEDRFLEEAMAPYIVGDRNWAVPMSSTDTSAIFYNVDMFEELGIDVPETYDDLVAAGQKIQEEKDIIPIIHQGAAPWYWPMWYMATFAQTSGNTSVEKTEEFLRGERQFDSAEEIAALEALQQITEDGLLNRDSMGTDDEGMRAVFLQQNAAMFYGLTPELLNIRDANPSFEVGVFQFPEIDAPGTTQAGGGPENGISITSFSSVEQRKNACQLMEFMTRPEQANIIFEPVDPIVPSIHGVDAPTDDALVTQLGEEFMPNTIQFLDWIWPNEVNDAVISSVVGVMYDGADPAEAAADIQATLDRLVAEEDYQFDWWETWSDDDWEKVSFSEDDVAIEVQ